MNKKLTFSGGEPDINMDDLLRDPVANRAALFGGIKGLLGTTDAVISGAEFSYSGSLGSVTAGYVWLDGEILQVDADDVEDSEGTGWEFQKVTTYESGGDKTFNDLTARQTWQKNRAQLVNVASVTGMDAENCERLDSVVWQELTNNNSNGDIVVDSSNAYIGRGMKGQVVFKGYVTVTGSTAVPLMTIFTVPTDLRPARTTAVGVVEASVSGNATGGTFTNASGEMTMASGAGTFYLDNSGYTI